jgi:aryl-alcohol dehydrogenase-like predicted oxidoreductase
LKGLGIVVWSPLAGGFLTGKYKPGQSKVTGSRSEEGWAFPERYFAPNADETLATLLEVANEIGRTPAQVATRWTLEQPAITSAIIGARTLAQADDNLRASGWKIPAEALDKLNKVSALPPRYPRSMEANMHERRNSAVKMPSLQG